MKKLALYWTDRYVEVRALNYSWHLMPSGRWQQDRPALQPRIQPQHQDTAAYSVLIHRRSREKSHDVALIHSDRVHREEKMTSRDYSEESGPEVEDMTWSDFLLLLSDHHWWDGSRLRVSWWRWWWWSCWALLKVSFYCGHDDGVKIKRIKKYTIIYKNSK